ncbi:hypothetical protein B0F90DRAFT_1714021 [Multifurca ochricompacta]|uniref:Arrestin C-terminal-like domain-containing protein n=1 Tax=Multifurca ochricompacta TaxID=376703 RepID=A0AAD4M4Z1_9AGAM|nr:hypothetical protein B0F90DRAFT_1714021 [Multifurca ochricompacta]
MQYVLSISGRVVPIGGIVPMTLSFLPMSKVRIYRIFAQLEERVDYFTFTSRARRTEATRCFNLLSLQSKDKNLPLLPLPQTRSQRI